MGMVARGIAVVVVAVASIVAAQPKSTAPVLVGGHEVQRLTATTGFIDDPIAFDDKRLAYVIADGSSKAELHVVALGAPAATGSGATLTNPGEAIIDLAAITTHPITLELAGTRALVIGTTEAGAQIAALIELTAQAKRPAGAVVYKLGPATQITLVKRDGKERIAVHTVTADDKLTRHSFEIDALDTGKRIAAGPTLELDGNNTSKKLDFHINHWADGFTRAFGVKGGEWDKKENQRSPDVEATYDVITGKLSDKHPIDDLFEQRKRFQVLADAGGTVDFVRTSWDNTGVLAWRNGKPKPLELDQPLSSYDPKSLQGVLEADGTTWIALKVDPTNPDAVARKKADPEYFDIFRAGPDNKAVRKLRVLSTGARRRFGVVKDELWVFERSSGFDRGGKSLAIYKLD
jgi:hypothetical protein